ncbi:alpha-N-acetylneuraminide alpha-2,8-sialyltransferase isoform X3 [Talpa occidentalis]|uniref:alpha-N-acetylneuraminide alpha-2,8-sialyltransferase isoform X3 n=1 Tax=Talpa occidentalis TaxID=50954 RepID=UPI0023F658EC|nr:alpha-N-acetylneuraminide alpha-2,8-sialyltransferase isoform X3 [Talpa occidentalis]
MSPCGLARRHTSRGAMAVLAWKFPRTRLPVGASALCVVVLCWLYIFPVYRLPNEKDIVQGVLQQGTAWRRNQTAARVFRKQMEDCCDPAHLFAMTKMNSPMGKSMWYDGEFLYSFTIDNSTYSLFPQATPFQLPLKKCAVVGNGGILKNSGCGRQIDEANFVMRCNLPPLSSEYTKDVGSKSHLVTANPSIIRQRTQKKDGEQEGGLEEAHGAERHVKKLCLLLGLALVPGIWTWKETLETGMERSGSLVDGGEGKELTLPRMHAWGFHPH